MTRIACALLALLIGALETLSAAESHPRVAPFERFYASGEVDLARGGELLLGELNCTSCHKLGNELKDVISPKQAPRLTGLSSRVKVDHLRAFLAHPHTVKPGTTMPAVFAELGEPQRAARVEALVHYLMSDATGTLIDTVVSPKAVQQGAKLFHEVGCGACHGLVTNAKWKPLATDVPLGDVAAKYTVNTLAAFLKDPLAHRPSARMPNFQLKDEESRAIASWFMRNVQGVANVQYAVYEGNFNKLPAFNELKPKTMGQAVGLDLSVVTRPNNVAVRFEGYLHIAKSGMYTFQLGSDDGSRLTIDKAVVVDHDGVHAPSKKEGRTRLLPGAHHVVVEWFNGGAGAELSVEMEGTDFPRQSIEALLTLSEKPSTVDDSKRFVLDPAKVSQGRELFASAGCASCHERKEDAKTVAATLKAKAFKELGQGGCLAVDVPASLPRYNLNDRQRQALTLAVQQRALQVALKDVKPVAPQELVQRTLVTFNCLACHERDKLGGPETTRDEVFLTTTKEFGDEGRLPPRLDGVGGKLNASYLNDILNNGSDDRPYLLAKMPRYGNSNVGHLTPILEKLDALEPLKLPEFSEPEYRVKGEGRLLTGSKGFSCIKCHNFNKQQAEGIPGIDLTLFTKRLRQEWFHKYSRDPQSFRPGTRMPSAWPKTGLSLLPKVLEGDCDQQVAAVWAYLKDGTKAATPSGVGGQPIELLAYDEAIIYRNFIDGAGPRAIGVGHPEKANLAWDANHLQLALIWHGAFIDAAKHWSGRGQGYQIPLGDHVVRFTPGVPFARLDSATTVWPKGTAKEQNYQFLGYRLGEKQRPTFMYSLGEIRAEDYIVPASSERNPGILRTLALSADKPAEGWYFRAAAGKQVEALDGGWYRLDGICRIRVESDGVKPVLRPSGDVTELLVPVVFRDGKARIVQEFQW